MQAIIKQVLKNMFPLVLLRRAQLELNKLRIKTVDKIIFPEQEIPAADFIIQRDDYPFKLYSVESAHLDARLQEQFGQKNQSWTQDEYLLVYDQPCIIEPRYGWAVSASNKSIFPSLGFSRAPYLHKPDTKVKSLRDAPLEEYAELVSLRDTGEENYFHFYNDVLAKLFYLEDKLQLPFDVPILISKKLFDKAYFQYYLVHPYLQSRHWIIQDEQYIRSRRTYFCKPFTHTPQYYARIRSLVHPAVLLPLSDGNRRLFITRSPQRLRYIENNSEIAAICQQMGFEVIDFDEISLPEQIKAMSQARYVVGIHGAGLTSMLFRAPQKMGLLEIYPPGNYYPFHYALMANQFGYEYDGLIGLPGSQPFSGGFRVDVFEMKQRLLDLLKRKELS